MRRHDSKCALQGTPCAPLPAADARTCGVHIYQLLLLLLATASTATRGASAPPAAFVEASAFRAGRLVKSMPKADKALAAVAITRSFKARKASRENTKAAARKVVSEGGSAAPSSAKLAPPAGPCDVTLGGWAVLEAVMQLSSTECGLKHLIDAHGEPGFYADKKDGSPLTNFQSLARAIVYQQLAGKAAFTIWGRLLSLAADEPGRGNATAPAGPFRQSDGGASSTACTSLTPARCLELGTDRLRSAGLSGQKASYILDLARAFSEGGMDRLCDMPDDEMREKLLAIRGVGPWTVDMFAIFTLHRSDILPTGDLGVRKGMQAHFGLKDLPTPAKMTELSQVWRPYRSVATWYMWRCAGTELPASAKASS